MSRIIDISGGAGPAEAAAIAAVIARLFTEEVLAAARPPETPRQSAWVESWRPAEVNAPLPSSTYDAAPWGALEPPAEGEQ